MISSYSEIQVAIDSFAAQEVPDKRTRLCNVELDTRDDNLVVTGTVSTGGIARRLFALLRAYPRVDREASSLTVLEDIATKRTVDRTAIPIRSEPHTDAEQVTQALYGERVICYDTRGDWRRVTAPDRYLGWVRADQLVSSTSVHTNAFLRENVSPERVRINSDTTTTPGYLPIGAPCEVVDSHGTDVSIKFRTGLELSVPADCVSWEDEPPTGSDFVEVARQFTTTDYEWGGMTTDGVDCSGLVWVSHRTFGVNLPRDADQQRRVGESISREELRPGDLLFFPGHVAISTGGARYLHAYGSSASVVENSLDPSHDEYVKDLDENLACCRRLFPET